MTPIASPANNVIAFMLVMLAASTDGSGPDTRGGANPPRTAAAETIACGGQIAPDRGVATPVSPLDSPG